MSKRKAMNTHVDKTPENNNELTAEGLHLQEGGQSPSPFVDNRPEAIAQRKLQESVNNRACVKQFKAFQDKANSHSQARHGTPSQEMADKRSAQPVQNKKNETGLPDNLKSGIETLGGYSMDDVNVHYNSDKPAQLQAHAYAQGTDIHLGPGQEKHLPHEAWHVAQQKQGRVKPTVQLKGGANINDDDGLEMEADVMGAKAMQMRFDGAHDSGCGCASCMGPSVEGQSQAADAKNQPTQLVEMEGGSPGLHSSRQPIQMKDCDCPKRADGEAQGRIKHEKKKIDTYFPGGTLSSPNFIAGVWTHKQLTGLIRSLKISIDARVAVQERHLSGCKFATGHSKRIVWEKHFLSLVNTDIAAIGTKIKGTRWKRDGDSKHPWTRIRPHYARDPDAVEKRTEKQHRDMMALKKRGKGGRWKSA